MHSTRLHRTSRRDVTVKDSIPYVPGIVVKFKNFKIKFVKVQNGQSIQVFIRRRPVDVGIAMSDHFNVVNET